jgi:diguanylate cyclase (GGDEF)-like protein
VGSIGDLSLHVLRARRTAALSRASLAVLGILLVSLHGSLSAHPTLSAVGFGIILSTAVVQLVAPGLSWMQIEESLAAIAGVLIIGLGEERVTALSVLWLCAVAAGVLARGGRLHWFGRYLILAAVLLPIARYTTLSLEYACLCLGALALLLTCGRLTRELNHLLDQARFDADHDGLTGALSRSAFRARLDAAADPARSEDTPVAMLLLDLTHFGQVNKFSGHAAGDRMLRTVVSCMSDAIGDDGSVGRLGGDEFAAIVPAHDAEALAERILADLQRPDEDAAHGIVASMGVACAPRDGTDADTLLRAADVALRVAKRSGRQKHSVYLGGSLNDEGPEGARQSLEALIAGQGLSIAVQPIVDLDTRRVHAYEALARFGVKGGASPLQWFSLADELGLRQELELACLSAALDLFEERPGGSLLSVNLSGPLLFDARTQAILDARATLDGLMVEITEDALIEDDHRMQAAIAPLVARGVRFAVDDMGAGYSGLRQIISLRPTYLKLDRSLVRGIDADPEREAMVAAMLGYARSTGGHLVAEGVETAEELAALVTLGVPLVQGYYLGRPGAPWPEGHTELIGAAPAPPLRGGDPPMSVAA